MKGLLALVFSIALCADAAAQAFSPWPHYSTREGSTACFWFGSFAKCRTQLADRSLRGTARRLSRISYRTDYNDLGPSTAMGRSWSSVSLSMSEFDANRMTNVPNANVTGTPTVVFRGAVTWPTRTGLPPGRQPSSFVVSVPFRSPWSYSGKLDILCDYDFAGGTLANRAAWSPTPKGPTSTYHLDGFQAGWSIVNKWIPVGAWGSTGGCRDSAISHSIGAYTYLYFSHIRPGVQHGGNYRAYYGAAFVGINTTCITAIGTRVSRPGVAIPAVACNRLHVDFAGPTALFAARSHDPGTRWGLLGNRYLTGTAPHHIAPVVPSLVGFPFVGQTAWSDTRTQALRLTAASLAWLPALPPWSHATHAPRRALYEFPAGSQVVRLLLAGGESNPICWYQ